MQYCTRSSEVSPGDMFRLDILKLLLLKIKGKYFKHVRMIDPKILQVDIKMS